MVRGAACVLRILLFQMITSTSHLDRAQRLHEAFRRIQLSNMPLVDLRDRVSLITVAAGLRSCGVLDGSGVQLELAREVLINHGLLTWKTIGVWSKTEVPREYFRPELFLFLSNVVNQNAPTVLWFCTDREERRRLKASSQTGSDAGRLLDYPLCCVSARMKTEATYRIAILNAIIQKVSDDDELVKRAILNGERVTVSSDHVSLVTLSNEKFPFISHVACADCCENGRSPSALLDEQYGALTKEIDPALHDALVRVAKVIGQAEAASSQVDRDKIFREMELIRSETFPLSVQGK
jgi:hypothetical protein